MKRKGQAILKIILLLLLIIVLLKFCLIFLWPFFLSFIIAVIIEPLVNNIMKFGVKRSYSVAVGFILLLLIVIFMASYISGYAYSHLQSIFNQIPRVLEIIGEKFNFLNEDNVNYNNIISSIEGLFTAYRGKILGTVLSTVNGLIYIVIILLISFFLSLDLDIILINTKKLIPREYNAILRNVSNKILNIVLLEFKLMFFTTLQVAVGLYILGIEEPLTVGIICGILDLLPMIGPSIVFIPWIIYEFLTKNIFLGFGLTFLFLLIQVIRQVLHIKYVGDNLKIRPFAVIFSLYIGIILFGAWGIILGPLLIILAQEFYNNLYEGRNVL